MSPKVTATLSDNFGIPVYPTGATEHWGIITYTERLLFTGNETVRQVDGSRTIIAHELAHNVGFTDDGFTDDGFTDDSYRARELRPATLSS